MADEEADKDKKTFTYTYTSDGKNPSGNTDFGDPFDIFEAFFGNKKKPEEKKGLGQKIKNFRENHTLIFVFAIFLVLLAFIFLVFYIMSVSSWNNGKCLLLVPYFSSSTSGSCEGIDSAFSNAVYLSITFTIVIVLVTIFNGLSRK